MKTIFNLKQNIMKTEMKKLFFACVAVLLTFASCEENSVVPGVEYVLSADPLELEFNASGNSPKTITVTSKNMEWNVGVEESGKDWITIEKNENTVTVNVSNNKSESERCGKIVISSSVNGIEPVIVNVTQKEPVKVTALENIGLVSYYAKDFLFDTNGCDEWLFEMVTPGSEYEVEWITMGKEGYWNFNMRSGKRIYLYLYSSESEDFFNPKISSGSYSACYEIGTMEPNTFLVTDHNNTTESFPRGSYIMDYSNQGAVIDIIDGVVELEYSGSEYHILMNFILGDESEVSYEFTGEMKQSIIGNPPYYSDLKENLVIETKDISQCAITSSVDVTESITQWMIELLGDGLSVDQSGKVSGTGYYTKLVLFSPVTEKENGIPDGTYDVNITDSFYPNEFTALVGMYNPIGNSGCYIDIYDGDNLDFAPISEGKITSECVGDGVYKFVVEGKDDNGHNISISYEGTVKRIDIR